MARQRTGTAGANALKRAIQVHAEHACAAPPDAVYGLLADPASHLVWAGERQGKKTRLLSVDSPPAPVGVGDEFSTTGADPMGRFSDRSVVTEATAPSTFEFVTEATLTTKKGDRAVWTNVHRYEIAPAQTGCTISYTMRIERISALPGMLAIFNWPIVSGLAVGASTRLVRKGVANLAAMAQEPPAA